MCVSLCRTSARRHIAPIKTAHAYLWLWYHLTTRTRDGHRLHTVSLPTDSSVKRSDNAFAASMPTVLTIVDKGAGRILATPCDKPATTSPTTATSAKGTAASSCKGAARVATRRFSCRAGKNGRHLRAQLESFTMSDRTPASDACANEGQLAAYTHTARRSPVGQAARQVLGKTKR